MVEDEEVEDGSVNKVLRWAVAAPGTPARRLQRI